MALKTLCSNAFVLVLVLSLSVSLSAQINFQEISIEAAEKIIAKEEMPYIIYFSGKWCPPCKAMEETTFKDEKLVARIKENYLAFKVDVDKPTGKKWIKTYALETLPTTLFYNNESKLINRKETPLTASQFLKLTAEESSTENLASIIVNTPTTPPPKKVKKLLVASEYQVSKKSIPVNTDSEYVQKLQKNQKILSFLKLAPAIRNGQQFIVQIGIYKNVRTAERVVQTLKNKVKVPIKVAIEREENVPVHIVYLGEFETKQAAITAKNSLSKIHQKGVVLKF